MTKPSDALRKIRVAITDIVVWNGNPKNWPSESVHDAYDAVCELITSDAAIGSANERPSTEASGTAAIITTTKLHSLAGEATRNPEAQLRLVAFLGLLGLELSERAVDIGTGSSQEQQDRASNPRYQMEKREQLDTAARIYTESRLDDSHPHYGQFPTVESIAREVVRRLDGDDQSDWKRPPRTIAKRLRKDLAGWQRDARPYEDGPSENGGNTPEKDL